MGLPAGRGGGGGPAPPAPPPPPPGPAGGVSAEQQAQHAIETVQTSVENLRGFVTGMAYSPDLDFIDGILAQGQNAVDELQGLGTRLVDEGNFEFLERISAATEEFENTRRQVTAWKQGGGPGPSGAGPGAPAEDDDARIARELQEQFAAEEQGGGASGFGGGGFPEEAFPSPPADSWGSPAAEPHPSERQPGSDHGLETSRSSKKKKEKKKKKADDPAAWGGDGFGAGEFADGGGGLAAGSASWAAAGDGGFGGGWDAAAAEGGGDFGGGFGDPAADFGGGFGEGGFGEGAGAAWGGGEGGAPGEPDAVPAAAPSAFDGGAGAFDGGAGAFDGGAGTFDGGAGAFEDSALGCGGAAAFEGAASDHGLTDELAPAGTQRATMHINCQYRDIGDEDEFRNAFVQNVALAVGVPPHRIRIKAVRPS